MPSITFKLKKATTALDSGLVKESFWHIRPSVPTHLYIQLEIEKGTKVGKYDDPDYLLIDLASSTDPFITDVFYEKLMLENYEGKEFIIQSLNEDFPEIKETKIGVIGFRKKMLFLPRTSYHNIILLNQDNVLPTAPIGPE
jgi:hypothetical protein